MTQPESDARMDVQAGTNHEVIREVRSIARSYFADEVSPAHDWHHVERVEALCETLAAKGDDIDKKSLQLSVLLHDIGRAKEDRGEIGDHAVWGAEESKEILAEFEIEPETVGDVVHCIKAHRYSNEVEPATQEAAILSDADNLDALGAVGLARCFAHGTEIGSSIHDPSLPISEDTTEAGQTQLNHLYKKILNLPNRMYTDTGKRIAEERGEFVEQFIDRFEAEAQGDL